MLTVNKSNSICAVSDLMASCLSCSCSKQSMDFKLDGILNVNFVNLLKEGYECDSWCKKFEPAARGMLLFQNNEGLWFVNKRLVIPNHKNLCGILSQLAHNCLGHFGFKKSYAALWEDYYWPNMRTDLESGYIPACEECQRNKDSTTKPAGPLHPSPVPDGCCKSIAMDFIGLLPVDNGCDTILTIMDRLGLDIQLVPRKSSLTVSQLAELFFDRWYCENGMPEDIISDRDKLFMSAFWHPCISSQASS